MTHEHLQRILDRTESEINSFVTRSKESNEMTDMAITFIIARKNYIRYKYARHLVKYRFRDCFDWICREFPGCDEDKIKKCLNSIGILSPYKTFIYLNFIHCLFAAIIYFILKHVNNYLDGYVFILLSTAVVFLCFVYLCIINIAFLETRLKFYKIGKFDE